MVRFLGSGNGASSLQNTQLMAANGGCQVCAPYAVLRNYKYKVKLTPGKDKKGKVVKSIREHFVRNAAGAHGMRMRTCALGTPCAYYAQHTWQQRRGGERRTQQRRGRINLITTRGRPDCAHACAHAQRSTPRSA